MSPERRVDWPSWGYREPHNPWYLTIGEMGSYDVALQSRIKKLETIAEARERAQAAKRSLEERSQRVQEAVCSTCIPIRFSSPRTRSSPPTVRTA